MADSTDPDASTPTLIAVAFPLNGRLLGIDFGTKRIGLAVCNAEQTIASSVENWTRQNLSADAARLRLIVTEYRIAGIIVGLPVHMSGDEGGKALEARQFGDWVARQLNLPLRYFDERYTTLIAEQHLISAGLSPKKRKARLDKMAAQVLLQAYLNSPARLSGNLAPADLRKPE